jgi:anthranilate phosphoribosyltransferase
MEDAVSLAADIIDSGKAYEKMEEFVKATQA